MHRRFRIPCRWPRAGGAIALLGCALAANAQSPLDLKQAFDAAWARQPEAQALQARRDAVEAQRRAARSWTPEPAAIELSNRSDRLHRDEGLREREIGIAVPLWLPGERGRSGELAEAEAAALESRLRAAQLRLAASVRESWWQAQRARLDAEIARDQLAHARRIAADVARRAKAGDLARADQHQAEGAVAAAESSLAQAEAAVVATAQGLRVATGLPTTAAAAASMAAEADPAAAAGDAPASLAELQDRLAVAERSAALAATQSRANPELRLAATRERDAFGERYDQSFTVGVRIPFGAGARHESRVAAARADAAEARAQLALERERVMAERETARVRIEAARTQLAAAERRATLARESRGFFDKAFALGEADLPTRLRIEAEAVDAERQAARSRIDLAAAVSAWRQALGLLPQ